MPIEINYMAVFVAALFYYAGGALWYSPVLFGKQWMVVVGMTEEKMKEASKTAWKSYVTAAGSALLISYGLARVEAYMSVTTLVGGLYTGFWAWLCFSVTTAATNNSFAGRPLKLLLIDSGYHLYGFLVMSILLVVWR